ncbi:hypothetical protein BJV85_002112 [Clostridium acetobutylicum]|uniref:Phage protein n=1 Tax=Clostridium acetobutylicum (strain ATCC 824 / DSM 792 / JCM 1419 / IAM 19013 / LMG 5710 / NBRC 13948 / NRRL B-527 / VKM B-1787 / 2291 / W) TaxID=272562 RepID=Q97HX2_CLOAB|nr:MULTISPECIES: hypothetical protein [Clostridium]AAK79848.1 Hypothetical protein CA_C1884 [Clostridium acetobutylicum ATCC 824]AEI32024.1 hypothetical protein SMB_G1909 [Clostridium acetobutylicum DSM 1731]ADZ20934.1 Conserved hypothetical protein [Clostridium acetobutylicum EA 2018]AWV79722.1 hypothetical protein DK921_06340 [Clostridium acetobutylicum]MBC2394300.1 hypothetical protein [Clostridium acetobutylicum]
MLIIATTKLNIPEEKFWKMTARKFFLLWEDYREFNGLKSEEEKVVYANEIF